MRTFYQIRPRQPRRPGSSTYSTNTFVWDCPRHDDPGERPVYVPRFARSGGAGRPSSSTSLPMSAITTRCRRSFLKLLLQSGKMVVVWPDEDARSPNGAGCFGCVSHFQREVLDKIASRAPVTTLTVPQLTRETDRRIRVGGHRSTALPNRQSDLRPWRARSTEPRQRTVRASDGRIWSTGQQATLKRGPADDLIALGKLAGNWCAEGPDRIRRPAYRP